MRSNGPPSVVFDAGETCEEERIDLTSKVTAQRILIEGRFTLETPWLAVRSVHGRHLHIVGCKIRIEAVRAFTRSQGVGGDHVVGQTCAKPPCKRARTVVFVRGRVVVVSSWVGATRHRHFGEYNGNALIVEGVRIGIVPLEIQGQIDHTVRRELTNQNPAIGTSDRVSALSWKQKPRTTNERVDGEPTASFKGIEVIVHANLLNIAGSVGIC